jgi:hypothetical protein
LSILKNCSKSFKIEEFDNEFVISIVSKNGRVEIKLVFTKECDRTILVKSSWCTAIFKLNRNVLDSLFESPITSSKTTTDDLAIYDKGTFS